MKLIFIFGPPAVGKMTVGHELTKVTDLKLFHNHMTIELVIQFFEFGTKPFNRLLTLFRKKIFEEVAKSDLKGMIFTYVRPFDSKKDEIYIDSLTNIFIKEGGLVYFVELEADLEERLRRNRSEFRLTQKASKRDVEASEALLLKHEEQYRFNSYPNEIKLKNYLKINNTQLSSKETAQKIKNHFKL